MTGNAEMKVLPEKRAIAAKGRCSPMMKSAMGSGWEIRSLVPLLRVSSSMGDFRCSTTISFFVYCGSSPVVAMSFDQYE